MRWRYSCRFFSVKKRLPSICFNCSARGMSITPAGANRRSHRRRLMKEAGLTHGGFYGHFASKEDLIAAASGRALMRSLTALSKAAERAPDDPLSAVADAYLTSRHRDNPGTGCLLAALGPDVSRQGPAVRRGVTEYVRGAVDLLTTMVQGKSKAARRQKAISTYATLVGTMVIARAVHDRALSEEILDAGLASVNDQ